MIEAIVEFSTAANSQTTKPLCRHCGQRPQGRARGLCHSCYFKPHIRCRYPAQGQLTAQGMVNSCSSAPLAAEPTTALPGTKQKVRVMAERAHRREQLFHPADA